MLRRELGALVLAVAVLVTAGCNQRDDTSVYGGTSSYHPPEEHTRAASYRGVQVEVPASWRPARLGCAEPDEPYVARPVTGCDASAARLPTHPAVWFDSPLPVGSRTEAGLHVRTAAVGGRRLTVATDDAEATRRILDSAHTVRTDDNGCPVRPPAAGPWPDEGLGGVYDFAVCLYPGERAELFWSARLPAGNGERFVRRLTAGERLPGVPYRDGRDLPLVVLVVKADPKFGTFPTTVRFRVQFDPGRIFGGPQHTAIALDRALVAPWLVPGVRTYLPSGLLPGSSR